MRTKGALRRALNTPHETHKEMVERRRGGAKSKSKGKWPSQNRWPASRPISSLLGNHVPKRFKNAPSAFEVCLPIRASAMLMGFQIQDGLVHRFSGLGLSENPFLLKDKEQVHTSM
jgi:hypothetical protein